MKIQNAFNDFYNEFKDWTKEEILQRTFDIILESSDKDRQLETYENMRKEVLSEIEYFELQAQHLNDDIYLDERLTQKLKDILNKVGEDNE
jgi:hypothetical protein